MPLFNPPAVGSPPDALYYTATSNSLLSAEIPLGRSVALGDRPPATPGAYDEEFEGTADTLPTNWAWTSAPSGSDATFINSRWPSLFTVEGNGNTAYTLTRSSFAADATFGIWFKAYNSPLVGADSPNFRIWVMNSDASAGRCVELRVTGAGGSAARGLKRVASVESAWGSAVATSPHTSVYLGMTRSSNSWAGWASFDGIAWFNIAGADSQTFTVDRIRFNFNTSTTQGLIGLDWVRYRTDTAFPRS